MRGWDGHQDENEDEDEDEDEANEERKEGRTDWSKRVPSIFCLDRYRAFQSQAGQGRAVGRKSPV